METTYVIIGFNLFLCVPLIAVILCVISNVRHNRKERREMANAMCDYYAEESAETQKRIAAMIEARKTNNVD